MVPRGRGPVSQVVASVHQRCVSTQSCENLPAHAGCVALVAGVYDARAAVTVKSATYNSHQLYVGRVPNPPVGCDAATMFIGELWVAQGCWWGWMLNGLCMGADNLKVFKRAVTRAEIEAEGQFALGGVSPSLVRLACKSCTWTEASSKCPSSYHLCYEVCCDALTVWCCGSWLGVTEECPCTCRLS